MVSALCVLLPLICSPRPAAPQSKPATPQAAPGVPSEAALAPKLSELPRGAESGGVGFRIDLKNDATNVLRINRFLNDLQGGAGATGIQTPVEASRCAHIVIYQAPIMDSQMIKEVPREFDRNMPTFEGLRRSWERIASRGDRPSPSHLINAESET
jgi:hypothetical protein